MQEMGIDKVDRKILYALDTLGSYSMKDVASFAGISSQNLRYRIGRLAEEGVLRGFSLEVDLSKMGIVLGRLYLKFSGSRSKGIGRLVSSLGSRPLYLWSATGEYDVLLAFDALREGGAIASLMKEAFAGDILRSRFSLFTEVRSFDRGYLLGRPPLDSWQVVSIGASMPAISDSARRVLAHCLKGSGPMEPPLRPKSISDATGLDYRTVRRSLAESRDKGIIQRVRAVIDPAALGMNHYKIEIRLSSKAKAEGIAALERAVYQAEGSV